MQFISLKAPALNVPARVQSERVSSLMIGAHGLPEDTLSVIGILEHGTVFKPATAADRDALVSFLRGIRYADPLPERDSPNLDCLDSSELEAFAVAYERGPRRKHARAMFPDAKRGHVRALQSLGHYARNLLTARQCRTRGDILSATNYEKICEGIYSRLPQWAKW